MCVCVCVCVCLCVCACVRVCVCVRVCMVEADARWWAGFCVGACKRNTCGKTHKQLDRQTDRHTRTHACTQRHTQHTKQTDAHTTRATTSWEVVVERQATHEKAARQVLSRRQDQHLPVGSPTPRPSRERRTAAADAAAATAAAASAAATTAAQAPLPLHPCFLLQAQVVRNEVALAVASRCGDQLYAHSPLLPQQLQRQQARGGRASEHQHCCLSHCWC